MIVSFRLMRIVMKSPGIIQESVNTVGLSGMGCIVFTMATKTRVLNV